MAGMGTSLQCKRILLGGRRTHVYFNMHYKINNSLRRNEENRLKETVTRNHRGDHDHCSLRVTMLLLTPLRSCSAYEEATGWQAWHHT